MTQAAQASPAFREFLAWSREARAKSPASTPLCETRLARALASFRPALPAPNPEARAHRCDLARSWCALRGVPALAPRAQVCEGVRHALSILFPILAGAGLRVALPRDVYPVYQTLATAAALHTVTVDTFPSFELPRIFASLGEAGVKHLLLPNPLKLHGRGWTPEETQQAEDWLVADPARRLLLDGVYSFGDELSSSVQQLLASDQVYYLDSLSKSWLYERVFGMAIVPERGLAQVRDAFRAASPSSAQLLAAQSLLHDFSDFPQLLRRELDRGRTRTWQLLRAHDPQVARGERGYLIPLHGDASTWLERGIVTLPLSVFGGTAPDLAIASSLPFVGEPA